jgi:hypothetical protein
MEKYQLTTFGKFQFGTRVFDRTVLTGSWDSVSVRMELADVDLWEAGYAIQDKGVFHFEDSLGRLNKLETV